MRIHGKPYSGNYRRNWRRYNQTAEWVMNDETALVLRKLKDADGNYIWNHNTDTIFGKSVFISDFMPNVNNGNKPIAFGDFSYYWIVNRSGILVRTLAEKFLYLFKGIFDFINFGCVTSGIGIFFMSFFNILCNSGDIVAEKICKIVIFLYSGSFKRFHEVVASIRPFFLKFCSGM